MKKPRKYQYTKPTMLAQAVLWYSSWKRHGAGHNPEMYENGYDDHKRSPSRTPRPEHKLKFEE